MDKPRQRFDDAKADIDIHGLTEERGEKLEKARRKKCKHCRDINKKSENNPDTEKGACKAYYESLKLLPCADCGKVGKFDMEADHVDGKVHKLSDYAWWACNGGVEAMKEEFERRCNARCSQCHLTNRTQVDWKRKYATLEEMPVETRKQKDAKRKRKYIDEKLAYVNQHKLSIGACQLCWLKIEEGNERFFPMAHLEGKQRNKANAKDSVSTICRSRQCFLTAKPLLDKQFEDTRPVCIPCHRKETHERNSTSCGKEF